MNDFQILPDDPKLTAYALGELEGDERAAVEAALRQRPDLRAVVADIRALAGRLEGALAQEAADPGSAAAPAPTRAATAYDPYARVNGSRHSTGRKLLQFPQVYYVVGGLAAACFAVIVALNPPEPRQAAARTYREIHLGPPATPLESASATAPAEVTSAQMSQMVVPAPPEIHIPQITVGTNEAASVTPSESSTPAPPPALESRSAPVAVAGRTSGVGQDLAQGSARPQPEPGRAAAAQNNLPTQTNAAGETVVVLDRVTVTADRDASATSTLSSRTSSISSVVSSDTFGHLSSGPASRARGLERRLPDPPPGAEFAPRNTESYDLIRDNDFLGATQNPLSTFSIDVDTASYAILRRFINQGTRPPRDAVRIEEMLNAFRYSYAPPKGRDPFAASIEVAAAPWAPTHRLVRIGLKAREVPAAERPVANLVFLLDVSGSMDAPNKLPLLKEALRLLVGRLRPDDRVAIVTYAGNTGLALPSTPARRRHDILAAIDALKAGGSTNGAMGIHLAYDIAKANYASQGINRVILCTDGDFNVGVSSPGELSRLIEEKARTNVFLTALGFGMGNYKDSTLEQLANRGNGTYGYIDSRAEAQKLLVEQASGTLMTVAKDVKVQVEFNPAKVASYRLIGYENRLLRKEDFNNDSVDAGEIGAGHTVTALYEVVPATAATRAATPPLVDELKYVGRHATVKEEPASEELLTVKIRYKHPDGIMSRRLEFPLVDRGLSFESASPEFQYAAAVASFGMLLRDSPYKGETSIGQVLAWAGASSERIGADPAGQRAEFIDLVRRAEPLLQ